jgi:hypothetical protein
MSRSARTLVQSSRMLRAESLGAGNPGTFWASADMGDVTLSARQPGCEAHAQRAVVFGKGFWLRGLLEAFADVEFRCGRRAVQAADSTVRV